MGYFLQTPAIFAGFWAKFSQFLPDFGQFLDLLKYTDIGNKQLALLIHLFKTLDSDLMATYIKLNNDSAVPVGTNSIIPTVF